MPRINYMISQHAIHPRLEPYARAYRPKLNKYDHWRVGELVHAMHWIEETVIDALVVGRSCDEEFASHPGKRTFRELWSDPNIWISFHTDPDPSLYAQAVANGQDIAVCYGAFRRGWRMVAATLIHEFAHVNGIVGTDHSRAEDTLLFCGMQSLHDETIYGYLQTMPASAVTLV